MRTAEILFLPLEKCHKLVTCSNCTASTYIIIMFQYCRQLCFITVLGLSFGGGGQIAWAQVQENKPPFVDHNSRVPQDLQSKPLSYKGFKYLPQLTLTGKYDSNIFISSQDEIGDYSLATTPEITIAKEYGRFASSLNLKTNIERFASESSENKNTYSAEFESDFYANSRWTIPFNAAYYDSVLDRSSPIGNLSTSEKPLEFSSWNANTGIIRKFNRLSLSLIGSYSEITYKDGISVQNGTPVVLSDNDRSTMGLNLGLVYELPREGSSDGVPEHYLFANVIGGRQDFKRLSYSNGAFSGVDKSRDTLSVLVGFKTGYKGILNAQLGAGILNQYFEDPTLDETSTYDLLANIDFALTKKATLNFLAGRDISQDNDIVQGIVLTDYNLGLDYEIKHNLYSSLSLGYTTSEFDTIDREDEDYSAGLELYYVLNPKFSAKASASHVFRDSTQDLRDYKRNIFMLSLTGRL